MIAFVRMAGIKPGRTAAALKFAKDMSAYLKGGYDVDLEVLRPIGGNPQRVAWSTRYADLAALEALNTKLMSDAKYWELVNGASDNFIAGSMHDGIWQTV